MIMINDGMVRIEETSAWAFASAARLDPGAAASASGTVTIARPPDLVWGLLRDVSNWPQVRDDVRDVVPLEDGAFTWSAGAVPVRSRFARAEPGHLLTWSTQAAGLEAVHIYRFEGVGSDTRLHATESMSGPLALQAITDAQLEAQIASWLAGLKVLAEGR